MGIGRSRICIGGEDLDWCGGKTLQIPIELKTNAKLKLLEHSCGSLTIISNTHSGEKKLAVNLEKINNWVFNGGFFDYVVASLVVFYKKTNIFPEGLLQIESNIPLSSGLCSSAAVLMATILELNDYFNIHLKNEEIVELAYYGEKNIVGATVGKMDYFASLTDSIFLFDGKKGNITKISCVLLEKLTFYLIFSGRSSSSKEVNQNKMLRYSNKEKHFINYKNKANELIELFIKDLVSEIDEMKFGDYINKFQKLMKDELQVSTFEIDKLVTELNKKALGTKITGCGLGGYIFSVVEKRNEIQFEHYLTTKGIDFIKC